MAVNYFRYDLWVKSASGPAIAGAQIWVCTQPANTTSTPPSPLATIFSDPNGASPITQPIFTDGFGHADFYAAPGLYTVVISFNGIIQQVYTDQSLGGIGTGGSGGTSLVISTNGVMNTNQLALNLESTDGSAVVSNDPSGNTDISIPAVLPPGGAAGQVLEKIDGTDFNTQWSSISSGGGVLGKWPGNWSGCTAAGINLNGFTLTSGANIGTAMLASNSSSTTGQAATSTQPISQNITGQVFSSGGIVDQSFNITLGVLKDWFTKTAVVGLTSSRYWFGMSDQTPSNTQSVMFSNTPAANVVAFRFTSGTDTTIKAVCQTDATHQTVVDTLVAPTPSTPQVFEIVPVGSTVTFYINQVLVATISTNVPATSVAMSSLFLCDGQGSGTTNEQFNFHYFWMLLQS